MTPLLSLVSPVVNLVKFLMSLIRRPDKAEVARLRTKWKLEFEQNLSWIDDTVGYGEVTIRDLKRMDSYPEVDANAKGVSPWFRVGLLGTYHRGIEVGLSVASVKYDKSTEAWLLTRDYLNRTLNAYVVGRIPYDRISSVDWTGDEYYYHPNIFCHFKGWRNEPYEEILICEKREGSGRPFYTKLTTLREAAKLQKRLEPKRKRFDSRRKKTD